MTFKQELQALVTKHERQQEFDALLQETDPDHILIWRVKACLSAKESIVLPLIEVGRCPNCNFEIKTYLELFD